VSCDRSRKFLDGKVDVKVDVVPGQTRSDGFRGLFVRPLLKKLTLADPLAIDCIDVFFVGGKNDFNNRDARLFAKILYYRD
jgi:hypothetical protein